MTQGDNAAMGYYACSMMPLIKKLMLCEDKAEYKKMLQLWYADDAAAGAKLRDMLKWLSMLCEKGPLYGYHPKPSKSWVIVKPQLYDKAKEMFPSLQVTDMGHKYLGSYIGRGEGKAKFVEEKGQEWIKDVEQLSDIAKREPQVYSACIYGISKRCNYECRTTPDISIHLKKLEYKISEKFIPACWTEPSAVPRNVARYLHFQQEEAALEYTISLNLPTKNISSHATERLAETIYSQETEYCINANDLGRVKAEITRERVAIYKEKRAEIGKELNDMEKMQLYLAAEKGPAFG